MSDMTFGEQLRMLRKAQHLSLREVETISGISNPYLSQLENNKVKQPSPRVLQKLAECYNAPFQTLMELAGHITKTENGEEKNLTLSGLALRSIEDLNPEEEKSVLEYIDFLRQRRNK